MHVRTGSSILRKVGSKYLENAHCEQDPLDIAGA